MIHWRDRLRAAGLHLCASILVAGLVAWLMLWLWYPHPYRELSGGRELFLLVVGVDVVLGPLITLLIFDRAKPSAELRRDLTLVVLIQLAALGYGLWSASVARPVHMVFEIDRMRIVHDADVPLDMRHHMALGIDSMPWTGPTLLAVRPFRNAQESAEATLIALQGLPLAARPDLWQPYADARGRVLAASRPLAGLKARFPTRAGEIQAVTGGRDESALVYLPLVGRQSRAWTVILDARSALPVGYVQLDSF